MKGAASDSSVKVSVIIPVYNTGPLLRELLDSLAAQTLHRKQYEVIAVDDGSTDDSGEILDEYADRYPQFRVTHQENSGWPGMPRNRGLDMARGTYVFFADSDDSFSNESLELMTRHADELGSDVVLPQHEGVGGRWVDTKFFRKHHGNVDVETVGLSLAPQKMFRREMLEQHQIRFPEGKVRLEDGMFVMRAYYAAETITVLSDIVYYYLRARDDGTNISASAFRPADYNWSIAQVLRIIRDHDPDPQRAGRMILNLYRRKCLKFYKPDRYPGLRPARRADHMREHRAIQTEFIPKALESQLENPHRRRSELIRAGDLEGALRYAEALKPGGITASVTRAEFAPTSEPEAPAGTTFEEARLHAATTAQLWVRLEVPDIVTVTAAPVISVKRRGHKHDHERIAFLEETEEDNVFRFTPELEDIQHGVHDVLDFDVVVSVESTTIRLRLHAPSETLSGIPLTGFYSTAHGNLSMS